MLEGIKRRVNTLLGVLVFILLLQAATIGGLGYVAYQANARANTAMAALTNIQVDAAAARTASQTARDYGRFAAALGPPCPAAEHPPAHSPAHGR